MMNNFTHSSLKLCSPQFLISLLIKKACCKHTSKECINNGISLFAQNYSKSLRLSKGIFSLIIISALSLNSASATITQVGGVQTQSTNNTSSVNISMPSGVQKGDILIINITKYDSNSGTYGSAAMDPIVYSGTWGGLTWNTVASSKLSGNASYRGIIIYRIVDGTEGSSLNVIPGGSWWPNVTSEISLVAYTGVNSASPFDVTPGNITTPSGTATTVNPASITTVSSGALVLLYGMSFGTSSTPTFSNWSVTTSPVLTELYDTGTNGASVGLATGIKVSTGTTGIGSFQVSNTSYIGGILLALAPIKQFRSIQSGNWNATSTWQQSMDNGITWVTATSTPTSADGTVIIQPTHVVTVTANVNVDQVTVNAGGQITVSNGITLTIADGAGTDMSVDGTIMNSGGTITTIGTLAFNSESVYNHAMDGGTIPAGVWDPNSTCLVTGVLANVPTVSSFAQNFGNFTWNCPLQTGELSLVGNLTTINGNLNIIDTHNGSLRLANGGVIGTLSVGGNYSQIGGTFYICGTSNPCTIILAVNGSFTLSGGTFNMSGNSGIGTLTVAKDYTHTGGTITESSSGSGSIIFNGTAMQTYTSGGTVNNIINFTVNSGAYLQMAGANTTVTGGGSFTLSSGATLGITSPNGVVTGNTASGNIQVIGGRTYSTGANYIYNGSAAQVTGNGLTGANSLTINNAAGVSLSQQITVSNNLILTNGVLTTTTTNLLSISNSSATAVTGGGSSTFVNGPLAWTLPSTTSGSIYNFPVGSGSTYLPFAISSPTTAATAQVQAFVATSGGTANVNATYLSAKSNTEYWLLTAGTNNFTTSSVSVGKGTNAIYPYDVIAKSTSLTGTYNSLNGTTGAYGVSGSDAIGTGAVRYFALAKSKTAKLNVSPTALSPFNYIYDFGPSALQSFTVNGNLLSNNITITPPTDYEISIDSGTTFSLSPVTVSKTVSTTVYVRLKAGLSVGTYNAETMTITSGVFTQTITCSGFVSATAPSIVAGGGIDCSTNTINLTSTYSTGVSSIYWTGPNSFYSTTQNPSITNATSVNEGTYTVTGSILSTVNLITNGAFEAGNTGFTSDYTIWTIGTPGDMSESRYAIVTDPSKIHSGYSDKCVDHTSKTGYQMVINGAGAEKTIWAPTKPITVTPNTNYQFIYWVQTVVKNNDTSPSKLQLYANGVAAGPIYTADATTAAWKQFVYNWNSGSSTTVNLQLKNENFDSGGNDFALDDISFQPVVQISSSVNVTLDKAPSLLIVTAAANPVAAGTNVTFSTVPTNGGTAPTFQWYVNGTMVTGATSPTYSYVPTNGDAVTCVMTPVGACVSTPVTSDPIVIMTVTSTPNLWVGTTSTSWSVPGNWSTGVVPKTGDDVIFATSANNSGNAAQNDLYADANHTIGNLTNNTTNRKLVIQPTQVVVVNQKITTNSADRIYIQSSPTLANGSLIFYNDQTTSPVQGTVEMYSKANYNATGVVYNGNTYNYTWQYFGIPIEAITADPTFYGSWVRRWNETGTDMTNHWVQLSNTDQLNPFYGYEITQQVTTGKTIVFQGQLVNRNFTTPVLASTSTALFPGQHILANPYSAAIDIKKFLTTNASADFDGSVYLYSTGSYADWGNAGGQGGTYGTSPGQYQAVNNTAGTGGLPSQIPSMQGFLVQVVTGSQPNSTISFNYNDVVKNSEQQRVKGTVATSAEDMVSTKVEVTGANYSDKMWIFTDSTFTKKYDKGWDGTKMYGSALAPQLYAVGSDGIYQINAVNDMNNTVLGFERGVDDTYTFTFTHENTDTRYSGIYLVDSIEHKTIDITASGSQYQFTVDSNGVYPNRFKIITRSYEQNDPEASSKIKVFNSNGMVFVQNLSSEQGQFSLYDMAGRQLNRTLFGPNSVTQVCTVAQQGIYVGKAATNSEKNTKRFIVQ